MNRKQRIYKKSKKRSQKESRKFYRNYMSRSSSRILVIRFNKALEEFSSKYSISILTKVDCFGLIKALDSFSKNTDALVSTKTNRPVWCGSTLEPSPTEQHPTHLSIMVES